MTETCIYCRRVLRNGQPCDMDAQGQPCHRECWAERAGTWEIVRRAIRDGAEVSK